MLKKPFIFVDNVDLNNYHLLFTNQETYLVTETFARFGKKNNGKLIQGMKMLPLNSFIIKLFMDFVNVEYLGESSVEWGLDTEKRYAKLDVSKTRKSLEEMFGIVTKNGNKFNNPYISFKPIFHNDVVKALAKEQELLAVETLGAYNKRYWFASSNKLGNLLIYVVLVQGKPSNQSVVSVNNFVFSIETIRKVMAKLEELTKFDENDENKEKSEVNE